MKKRVMAFMLCMAMILGDTSYAFAAETSDSAATTQTTDSQQVTETTSGETDNQTGEDTQQSQSDENTKEENTADESQTGVTQPSESQTDESQTGESQPNESQPEESQSEEESSEVSESVEESGEEESTTEETLTEEFLEPILDGADGENVEDVEDASVRVEQKQNDEWIGKEYDSLDSAIAGLTTDFGGKETDYTITFLTDTTLTKNVTIPSFVKQLNLNANENRTGEGTLESVTAVTLDFNNYSMTIPGTASIQEGLYITNSATGANKSNLTVNSADVENESCALNLVGRDAGIKFVDCDGNEVQDRASREFISKINVVVANGTIWFGAEKEGTYKIRSSMNAKSVYVCEGTEAELTALTLTGGRADIGGVCDVDVMTMSNAKLYVEEQATFCADSITVKTPYVFDVIGDYTIENLGSFTVSTLTMPSGSFYNEGTAKGTKWIMTSATIRNNGELDLDDTLDMSKGTFYNGDREHKANAVVTNVKSMKDFYNTEVYYYKEDALNKDGSSFTAYTFTQVSAGKAYLEANSKMYIKQSAVIYNTVLRGEYGDGEQECAYECAYIYQKENAAVALEGSVTQENAKFKLGYGIFDDEDGNSLKTLDKGTKLFTTKITTFPVDYVMVQQPEESSNIGAYQQGQEIRVGSNCITVYAQSADGSETIAIRSFTKWEDAATYLNSLSNASMSYVIVLTEDLDIGGTLTLPKSASKVEFRGDADNGGSISLTYKGDISLTTNTVFRNIDLHAQNTKTGAEYYSIVKLNGKNLELINTEATFTSITGTTASDLIIMGDEESNSIPTVTVTGAISNLNTLEVNYADCIIGNNLKATSAAITGVNYIVLKQANVEVWNGSVTVKVNATLEESELYVHDTGAISIAGTTTLESGVLLTEAGKITLKDVCSLNDKNALCYGGNTSKNGLTITGTVYGPESGDYYGDKKVAKNENNVYVTVNDTVEGNYIRKAALELVMYSLEDEENPDGVVLLSAPKVQAEWFVVCDDNGNITSLTHKESGSKANTANILYGALEDARVVLKQGNEIYGYYATLQGAFDEIERIGNAAGSYIIEIKDDTATDGAKELTTPTKAESIEICKSGTVGAESDIVISYKSTLTLKTNLTFQDVTLAPQAATNKMVLNDYRLAFEEDAVLSNEGKSTTVSGSGVAKNSCLSISECTEAFTFSSMVNVGELALAESTTTVYVNGTINIGDVAVSGNPTLYGFAKKVTRGTKDPYDITKIETDIKINGGVYAQVEGSSLVLGLREKKDGVYQVIDFYSNVEDEGKLVENGIQLAYAPNVYSDIVKVATTETAENGSVIKEGNVSKNDSGILTKSGGYLTYRDRADLGVILSYEDKNGETVETWCRTFAEAVTEINNLKTKRDYNILLLSETENVSYETPAVLTMPNKNYVDSLFITGWDSENSISGEVTPVTLYYTGNIVLSAKTILGDVDFVQMTKVNGSYVRVDDEEAKGDYPSAISFSTAGNNLTIAGEVTFNTPVNFAGANKETFRIANGTELDVMDGGTSYTGQLCTVTNESVKEDAAQGEGYILGSISKFAEIYIEDNQSITVIQYATVLSSGQKKYTAAKVEATTLYMEDGAVLSVGYSDNCIDTATPSVKFTNTFMESEGMLEVGGKAAFTNVTLAGDEPCIMVTNDFNITGTLTNTAKNATFITVRKGENKAPYLNISGKIMMEDVSANRITVEVMDYYAGYVDYVDGYGDISGVPAASLENDPEKTAPNETAQLLTAKNATANMFIPSEDNAAQRGEYSVENTDGYMVSKTGNNLYVYYGDEVEVALVEGIEYQTLSEAEEKGAVLGYYATFKDAVSAIEAKKDKTATYTLLLLQNVGESVPVSLTMPKTASKVKICGDITAGEGKDIYFTGNLTLGTHTEFAHVTFQPVKKSGSIYVGNTFHIANGAFALELVDVTIGETDKMALGNVTGNNNGTLTLSSTNLEVSGAVTKQSNITVTGSNQKPIKGNVQSKKIVLENGVTLTVNGTVTADKLEMNAGAVLDASNGGAVKVKDVTVTGDAIATIQYGRDKNSNPNLTISGEITIASKLILNLNADGVLVQDYKLEPDASKLANGVTQVKLTNNKKLATVEKTFDQSKLTMQLNGNVVDDETYDVVKANKGLYVVDVGSGANTVTLDFGGISYKFLDFTQAVNEISNLKQKDASVTIAFDKDITDTNVTDDKAVSAITMPKTGTCADLTLAGEIISGENACMNFSGNLSYAGSLRLSKIKLVVTGTTTIGTLTLENASSMITSGTATITTLNLCDTSSLDALGKTTITNINATSITVSENKDASAYIATRQVNNKKTGVPETQLIVKGTVNMDKLPLPVKVWKEESTVENLVEVDRYTETTSTVDDATETIDAVGLVVAPKENANKFIAYNLRIYSTASGDGSATIETMVANNEDITKDKWAAYKDSSNVVKNGNTDNMKVCISKDGDAGVTYAKSFEEAVKFIDTMGDTKASYTIKLLKGTEEDQTEIKTAKNGTAYGALTLPTKAASVTIDGQGNTLSYTGKLTPKCNITFENIVLTEGTVDKSGNFTPSYTITLAYGSGAYQVAFGEGVSTLKPEASEDEMMQWADLVLESVSGSKGTLQISGVDKVYVKGALSVKEAVITGTEMVVAKDVTVTSQFTMKKDDSESSLESQTGKLQMGTLSVDGASAPSIKAPGAITIGCLKANDASAALTIDTCFTKTSNAKQQSVTQLTINEKADQDVAVTIAPRMYDFESKTYHPMTYEEAVAMNVTDASKKPESSKKIASMPKYDGNNISLVYSNDGENFAIDTPLTTIAEKQVSGYKYEGGYYITTMTPAIKVRGFSSDSETTKKQVYTGTFFSWEQAIKEIDRIGNKSNCYDIVLLKNIGDITNEEAPIGTLTMPSKANSITVKSGTTADGAEKDNTKYIFFTKNSIALKCDTTFEGIGLMAVKKMGKSPATWYDSITFNMNAGNFKLTMDGMSSYYDNNGRYESLPGTISGTAKASFSFMNGDEGAPATKISGFGTVEFQSDAYVANGMSGITQLTLEKDVRVSCNADVNVKNLTLVEGSYISAKNVTVTVKTSMAESGIDAGTSTIGDGKVTLKDLEIAGDNNISAKQNKNGSSQLVINGTVTQAEGAESADVAVGIFYNNKAQYAKVYDGMTLLTAQKADTSWFVVHSQMGKEVDGYGVYKSGKEIKYGKIADSMEVKLVSYDETAAGTRTYRKSKFATFEEAVKEIDTRGEVGREYTITLLKDVEIGNEKGNGQYKALSLPSKAAKVILSGEGHSLSFSGNVTLKCNLWWDHVDLQPRKTVKGEAVATKVNYNVGNYEMTLEDSSSWDETSNTSLFGNITGTKKGKFSVCGNDAAEIEDAYYVEVDNISGLKELSLHNTTALKVNGNGTVQNLVSDVSGECKQELDIDGVLTVDSVASNGTEFILKKAAAKDMKVNNSLQGTISIVLKDDCRSGMKLFSGKTTQGIDTSGIQILKIYDVDEVYEYAIYQDGTNYYIGAYVSN